MDKFQRVSLDNYITGHWGEDSIRDEPTTAFDEGQSARDDGIPMNMNPYEHGTQDYLEWACGWTGEDMCLRTPEEL